MDVRLLVIDIAEKLCLVATAALVTVLLPPLRNRLLGVGGQRRERLVALFLCILLTMWGGKMGDIWLGEHVNFLAVGILMGTLFEVGAFVGLFGALFYFFRVAPTLGIGNDGFETFVFALLMGFLGDLAFRLKPFVFTAWRSFPTAFVIQLVAIVLSAVFVGNASRLEDVWPAVFVQIVSNATGILLFVGVARVVLAREESVAALAEAQAASNKFELEALRRRLEPHFLFNAFNTLRATIRVDPNKARTLVSDLSDLYRYLLTHPEDAPVSSEVEHALAYLKIEQARLGEDRLTVSSDVSPEVRALLVPALLLQPLVENAVKHGVGAHDGKGTVHIEARRAGNGIEVVVEDASTGNHVGVREAGSKTALRTLRERLEKRFGPEASISLEKTAVGMRALLRLPVTE